MPELGTFGTARDPSGNGRSYRDQYFCGETCLQTELPTDPLNADALRHILEYVAMMRQLSRSAKYATGEPTHASNTRH